VKFYIDKYSWRGSPIKSFEPTKETACFDWNGNRRFAKGQVFDAFEDAKAAIVEEQTRTVQAYRERLDGAVAKLAEYEKLQP
jgi:hypothetical protein